jgi:hypoxanthine phosphoribosyltransferase
MLSPVYNESVIAERVKEIASRMNADFGGEKDYVHVIVTLNGAFMFAADLIRQCKFPMMVHFVGASSYMGTEQQKDLRINADALPRSFGNKPVILIEDIVDSGRTIGKLRQMMVDRFAGTIKVVALLRRQGGGGNADYYGFTVPPGLFVVGYGLDLDGRFRELRDIQALNTATMMPGDTHKQMC